jgi:hypothetical protein
MNENERNDIYDAIVGDRACLIRGSNFELLNCGSEYCNRVFNGCRKIVISGEAYSLFSVSERGKFPSDMAFGITAPRIPLLDLTKVGRFGFIAKDSMSMDDLEELLKEKGAKFESFD